MVPLPRSLVIDNFHLVVTPIKEMVDFTEMDVVPMTETGKCPFLKDDYTCAVYELRPPVCRKFGDATHLHMTCAYQKPNGEARTKKEYQMINRKHTEAVKKFFKK
jgi:Fe-S-cluster containining protein